MTNSTDKTRKPDSNEPPTIILFGVDEHDKPRAARFTGHGTQLLAKAAAAMNPSRRLFGSFATPEPWRTRGPSKPMRS